MSGNNDTPLGGRGNVYDPQFADRIANISEGGGGGGAKQGSSGSKGGWGAIGGVAILIFILLRVLLAGSRGCSSQDRSPSYSRTPPNVQVLMTDKGHWNREMQDLAGLAGLNLAGRFRLSQDDLVFAPGLCRKIIEDTEKPGSTPGKRIYANLDDTGKGLVRHLARSRKSRVDHRLTLAVQLNRILARPDFYDVTTFRTLHRPDLPGGMAMLWDGLRKPSSQEEVQELNRRALEAAYPSYIVSCDLRGDDRTRLRKRIEEIQRRGGHDGDADDDRAQLRERLEAEHEAALKAKGN